MKRSGSGFIWRWRNQRILGAKPVQRAQTQPDPDAQPTEDWRDELRADASREFRRAFARTEPGIG